MTSPIVDLHVHSTKSDGTFTPTELVEEAIRCGLTAFALTDHDTTAGIKEAKAAAKGTNLTVIPGIELSCFNKEHEVHIVGLFIEEDNPTFQTKLTDILNSRDHRNELMMEKLREAGFSITLKELHAYFPNSIITRAHVARYLYETGAITDINVAFQKYIGDHCPCYVPREKVTPYQAIDLIHSAGGLAILAHPLLYHLGAENLKRLVIDLKNHGLDGLEAIYSTYTAGEEREMKQLAESVGLAVSGGSDFHGANKPAIHLATGKGNLYIPYSVLEKLEALKATS